MMKPRLLITRKLLQLDRPLLSQVVQLLTGHGWLLRHSFVCGEVLIPICRLCGMGEEEPNHLFWECEAGLEVRRSHVVLDITSWDGDTVKMEITIKVNGNDQERVIDKLKSIDVHFETSPVMVSAKTILDKGSQSWLQKLTDAWGGSNLKMEINYVVKVPVTNSINLRNDYGSITLNKIEGNAKINCDYGQIIIGELLGAENFINIDYTNNSTIKYMKAGKINADYSNFKLKKE